MSDKLVLGLPTEGAGTVIDCAIDLLLDAARSASDHAHCPYSHFPVGAAIETVDGRVFTGCNVENASFSLTMCAERVALFSAVSAGSSQIARIAVSCRSGSANEPSTLMPCGACRQVIQEFAIASTQVIVDQVGVFTLNDLFPQPFKMPGTP